MAISSRTREPAAQCRRTGGVTTAWVALGAGLGATQSANAVPMDLQQISLDVPLVLRGEQQFLLDLNADRVVDYVIDIHNYIGGHAFDIATYELAPDNHLKQLGLAAHNYLPGVGPVDDTWTSELTLFETDTPSGAFLNQRRWLGLYFDIPGGSMYYGYLDLEGSFNPDTEASSLTIYGGAFATEADTPIRGVAEPGTLGMLAAGAAGLAMWRRRRKGSTAPARA